MHQICGKQEPLQTLANCNLASFGKVYQHVCLVYPSFNSSSGGPILLEKVWLLSVLIKNSRMHTGSDGEMKMWY